MKIEQILEALKYAQVATMKYKYEKSIYLV